MTAAVADAAVLKPQADHVACSTRLLAKRSFAPLNDIPAVTICYSRHLSSQQNTHFNGHSYNRWFGVKMDLAARRNSPGPPLPEYLTDIVVSKFAGIKALRGWEPNNVSQPADTTKITTSFL